MNTQPQQPVRPSSQAGGPFSDSPLQSPQFHSGSSEGSRPNYAPLGSVPALGSQLPAHVQPIGHDRSDAQAPNALFVVIGLLFGLFFGISGVLGYQWYQEQRAENAPPEAVETKVDINTRRATANAKKHSENPGFWMQEQDRLLIAGVYGEATLQLLDSPKGMNERDLSSRPQAVAPKDYYTANLDKLFLLSDGQPYALTLDAQKKFLARFTEAPLPASADNALRQPAFRSDAFTLDEDGDGIVYFEERFIYNTKDTSVDTDGDTFSDKEEIEKGFDPTNKDAKLNGFIDSPKVLTQEERTQLEGTIQLMRGQWLTNSNASAADEASAAGADTSVDGSFIGTPGNRPGSR